MTDQSNNDVFHASSFMQGHNAEYIEQLYARYADNPNAVDESWQAFFKSLAMPLRMRKPRPLAHLGVARIGHLSLTMT